MAIVSLASPSCEVPCWILHSVVYQDVTRQAKGLHHLKYVGALERGLAYLSRCNSGWFCHKTAAAHRRYSPAGAISCFWQHPRVALRPAATLVLPRCLPPSAPRRPASARAPPAAAMHAIDRQQQLPVTVQVFVN
jgi:hypothetical protein